MLQFNNVSHDPKLAQNLIFIGQLSTSGVITSFMKDSWKMTREALVLSHGKKEGTLYVTLVTHSALMITSPGIKACTWPCRLGHMSEKGMKTLMSKGKLARVEVI